MKITEVQPGKKYTQSRMSENRIKVGSSRIRQQIETTVRVLQVDQENGRVLAAIGDSPSKWVRGNTTRHWKPFETKKQSI